MNLSQFADKPGGISPLAQLLAEFNRDDTFGDVRSATTSTADPSNQNERGRVLALRGEGSEVHSLLRRVPSTISQDTIAAIWGFSDRHCPAVHAQAWRELIPTDAEARMMMPSIPSPVGESIALPPKFRRRAPLEQLRIAGLATLETIERHRPTFHRSLLNGRLLEASGTTIMVTDKDGEGGFGVETVPWSYGETFKVALKRFFERRKHGSPALRPGQLALMSGYLPVWQAVVSVVPQDAPETSLFGSGGTCPTVIAIGRRRAYFRSEHRVFRPDHGKLFTSTWLAVLDSLCFK